MENRSARTHRRASESVIDRMKDPVEKRKYWIAISASAIGTTLLIYVARLLIPEEYFLASLIAAVVVGGFVLDWYIARRNASSDDD